MFKAKFSALTVWIFNVWAQIRILRVEILLWHTSKCLETSVNFSLLLFLPVTLVPEQFRKLLETPGNNFHLVSSKSKRGCPSYDQKCEKILKALTNRTGALITSTGVVLMVLVLVFVVSEVVLVVADVDRKKDEKPSPGNTKTQYQDHQDHHRTQY